MDKVGKNNQPSTYQELEAYFIAARRWYTDRYLYTHMQAIYILIIATTALFFAYTIFKFSTIDYHTVDKPVVIYTNDQLHFFPKIRPISRGTEPINHSVARYLITKYIQTREEYYPSEIVPEKWQEKLQHVRAMSSYKVFNGFINYVNTTINPNSPILQYGIITSRVIKVQKVAFPAGSTLPDTASVRFIAEERTKNKVNTTYWEADIDFSMPDIRKVLYGNYELQFTVKDYQAKIIR